MRVQPRPFPAAPSGCGLLAKGVHTQEMQWNLRSPAKRWVAATATIVVTAAYCGVATCRLLADRFAQSSDEASLRRASRLDPGNAEYQHMLGLHQLALQAPKEAIGPLNRATVLNPNSAKYWMDLAATDQLLGDSEKERAALNHALAEHSPVARVAEHVADLDRHVSDELAEHHWIPKHTIVKLRDARATKPEQRLVQSAAERGPHVVPEVVVVRREDRLEEVIELDVMLVDRHHFGIHTRHSEINLSTSTGLAM